jgi:hypothetical protein
MTENERVAVYGHDGKEMTAEMLAALGEGEVAYIRTFQSEDFQALFPQAPDMQPGQKLWALLSADGTPIVLADTPQAVMQNAMENDLTTVSLH